MDAKTPNGMDGFVPATLHYISAEQLATLGMDEIAFVKPVMTATGPGYAIHAADGTPLAIATNAPVAVAAIIQNEMVPNLVH